MSPGPLPHAARSEGSGAVPAGARRSYALEQFTEHLLGIEGGQVIDLGGACQSNIDYVTSMGHRLYTDDILTSFASHFAGDEHGRGGTPPEEMEAFLDSTLDFSDGAVDGVLAWDRLQFLPSSAAGRIVDRLHRALAPGGLILAMFHPEQTPPAFPQICRVADPKHLRLRPAGATRPCHPFSPRGIERFFQRFQSLKFYLTRENLQEVIVRR